MRAGTRWRLGVEIRGPWQAARRKQHLADGPGRSRLPSGGMGVKTAGPPSPYFALPSELARNRFFAHNPKGMKMEDLIASVLAAGFEKRIQRWKRPSVRRWANRERPRPPAAARPPGAGPEPMTHREGTRHRRPHGCESTRVTRPDQAPPRTGRGSRGPGFVRTDGMLESHRGHDWRTLNPLNTTETL